MAPRLNPILATAATLVALAACSQNPQFRMNMASQAYGALNELYVLLARADLGTLRAPASFADQAESYAVIIGGFEVAGLLAAGRPPGREPSEDLAATIGRCVDRLRRMSDQHRTAGIAPRAPITSAVRTGCDAAARSVAADEVSLWVFSTIAGDL